MFVFIVNLFDYISSMLVCIVNMYECTSSLFD